MNTCQRRTVPQPRPRMEPGQEPRLPRRRSGSQPSSLRTPSWIDLLGTYLLAMFRPQPADRSGSTAPSRRAGRGYHESRHSGEAPRHLLNVCRSRHTRTTRSFPPALTSVKRFGSSPIGRFNALPMWPRGPVNSSGPRTSITVRPPSLIRPESSPTRSTGACLARAGGGSAAAGRRSRRQGREQSAYG